HTTLSPGDKIFSSFPVENIATITLTQGEDSTQIVRTSQHEWGVANRENYPPDYELLKNLLGALHALKVTQGYPAKEENFGRFGLLESSETVGEQGLRITIKAKDGSTIADVMFGKYNGTGQAAGRYMRSYADTSGVYAVGETFPGVAATPESWLDKDFIKVEQLQSIAVSAPADPSFAAWKVSRSAVTGPTAQFKLDGMSEKETMKLTSTTELRSLFGYVAFQDVLDAKTVQETSHPDAKLKRIATLTTMDGLTYTLTYWPQKAKPKKEGDPEPDPRLPEVKPSYLVTLTTTANIQQKRTAAAGEKPEISKQLDAQFAAAKKATEAKLAAAKAFEGRTFKVSHSTIAPLEKKRSDFVKTVRPSVTSPPVRVPGSQSPPPLAPLPPQGR
ncbi:MAG: DUF4340 domain-containing protein, partial [Akkermansiaceae bacterium]